MKKKSPSAFYQVWDSLLIKERYSSIFLVFLMIISMILETMGVGLVIPYVTYLVNPNLILELDKYFPVSSYINIDSKITVLIYGMTFLCLFYLFKNLFLMYFTWWQTKFATNIQISISNRLFKKYLSKNYKFHLQNNSAILIRNVSQEAGRFHSTLASIITLMTEFFVIISLTMLLFYIEPLGMTVSFILMAVSIGLYYFATRKLLSFWGNQRVFHHGESLRHLIQGLSGIKDIKIFNREENFFNNFKLHNSKYSQADRWYNTFQMLPRLWLEFLAVLMLSVLVIITVLFGKDSSMVVPVLAAFAAAAFRLLPSLNRILISFQTLRFASPSIKIIYGELSDKSDNFYSNLEHNNSKFDFKNEIALKDLSFNYDDQGSDILKSIDFKIKKNEFIGIIGTSGSGKSTLVDLILGLLVPNKGEILVDGENIHSKISAWQKLIGYVPQDIYLTDDTIKKNIAFGIDQDQINEHLIQESIKSANIDHFIDSLPLGINTLVGERGVKLSGGQLQRIGIARALYNEPSLLVLDEATSSLDLTTEEKIMEAINSLKGSITILIISHRLSTVEKCDRVIKIEKGKYFE